MGRAVRKHFNEGLNSDREATMTAKTVEFRVLVKVEDHGGLNPL